MNESQLRTKVVHKCRGEKDKRSGDVEVLQLRSLVPYVYGILEIIVWNVPCTSETHITASRPLMSFFPMVKHDISVPGLILRQKFAIFAIFTILPFSSIFTFLINNQPANCVDCDPFTRNSSTIRLICPITKEFIAFICC